MGVHAHATELVPAPLEAVRYVLVQELCPNRLHLPTIPTRNWLRGCHAGEAKRLERSWIQMYSDVLERWDGNGRNMPMSQEKQHNLDMSNGPTFRTLLLSHLYDVQD